MADTTQYFASYCVVEGGGTNPMGHAFLLISKYDSALPNAQLEVLSATGLYPSPVPEENNWRQQLGGIYFFSEGHLKDEEFRDLVNLDPQNRPMKHAHKTWEITKAERDALKAGIEKDREAPLPDRNFSQEAQLQKNLAAMSREERGKIVKARREEQLAMKGPYFRVHDYSCKTDALKRLRSIGIEEAANLHNTVMDLPIYSGRMAKLELVFDETQNKLIWKSPLELSPRIKTGLTPAERARITAQAEFTLLYEGIEEIYNLFNKKVVDLASRGKVIQPISDGHAALKLLYDNMTIDAKYPDRVEDAARRTKYMSDFKNVVNTCKTKLNQQSDNPEIIKFLRELTELVKSIFRHIASIFMKIDAIPSKQGVINHAEACVNDIEQRMNRIKI